MQDDKPHLRRYVLGITDGLSLFTFPASLGMALVADQFVMVVLGAKWASAIIPLQLLALYAALRSITTFFPYMLFALRQSRFVMWNIVIAAIVFPAAFYYASRWGTTGIGVTWVLLYPLSAAPIIWRTLVATELSVWSYLRSMVPALRASLVMVVMVLGVRFVTPASLAAGRAVRDFRADRDALVFGGNVHRGTAADRELRLMRGRSLAKLRLVSTLQACKQNGGGGLRPAQEFYSAEPGS